MPSYSRRDFLRALGAGGACVAAGGTLLPQPAGAGVWGHYPADASAYAVPEALRARSVLEIFLFGGMSPQGKRIKIPVILRPAPRAGSRDFGPQASGVVPGSDDRRGSA